MQSTAGVFSGQYRGLTVGILLSITAVACEGMAVATVMPSVAQDLGGLDAYGWAFSAFMLASLVGAIAAGQAADRRDPGLPAGVGFALFSMGLIVSGTAPAWPVLLLGRAIQGLGAGGLGASAFVAMARGYPERLRPRLMALLSSAWILPALLGPAVAGLVAEHASWRWVFIGILPPVALGAWMSLPPLRRLAPEAVPADAPGIRRILTALRLIVGVALVLLVAGLDLPVALVAGALGLLLAGPALRSLLPTGTFTGGAGMPAAVGLRGLLALGFFGAEALIPLGLSTERGVPPSLAGLALTAGALAWVAASWVQERAEAAARNSLPRRAVRAAGGLLLIGLGTALAAAAIINASLSVELVMPAWALAGLGMGLAYPATSLTALGLAPAGQEGTASASLQVAETVGIATGTGAAGALITLSARLQHGMAEGLAWGFLLAIASILLALAPALRLPPAFTSLARWRTRATSAS